MPSSQVNPNAQWQASGNPQDLAKPITPDALQPVTPLQTPATPYQEPPADQSAAALQALQPQDLLAQMEAPSQAEAQQDDISNQLLQSIQKLGGQSTFQAQKEKELGLDVSRQQLMDVTNQLMALQNEAKAIPLQSQQDAAGRGITAGGLAPITSAALRNNAIKSLGLQSVAATLQGNIALAQQQADKAVEIEFAPERTRLEYLSRAYEMNRDRLEREDAKKARRFDFILSERNRVLQQAEQDRKMVIGFAAEATKIGNAPASVISQAMASNDPRQALSILTPYMSDPNEKAMALLELEFKREQIKNAQYDRYLSTEKLKLDQALTSAQIGKLQAEAIETANATTGAAVEANQTRLNAVDLVNNILEGNFGAVVGAPNPITLAAPSNALVRNQINQLRGILALENRAKLKGTGQISDYESKILNQAASALGDEGWLRASNLSNKDFANEVKKVRAVLTVMNGGTANVILRNPQTGETASVSVDRAGLNQAMQDRLNILYQ